MIKSSHSSHSPKSITFKKAKTQLQLFFFFLPLFFKSQTLFSAQLSWPSQICENETLVIQNSSPHKLNSWVQYWQTSLKDEFLFEILPQSENSIVLNHLESSDYTHKTLFIPQLSSQLEQNLQFKIKCDNGAITTPTLLRGGIQVVFFNQFMQKAENSIEVQNHASTSQDLELELTEINLNKKLISLKLKGRERKQFYLSDLSDSEIIKIRAFSSLPFTLFSIQSTQVRVATLEQKQFFKFKTDVHYFLIGRKDQKDDQFVIGISDPELLQKAREQINKPELNKIIFAEIEEGSDYENINFNSKDHHPWSWHVSRVTSLNDIASTSCNGYPQLVEDRLESWLKFPQKICFWNYRILKELK